MRWMEVIEAAQRILYLSGEGSYTRVHFLNGTEEVFSRTIQTVVADLPGFLRIHRAYAVNPAHVTNVRRPDPKTLEVLVGNVVLPVSRRRQSEIQKQLKLSALSVPARRTYLAVYRASVRT